jgi:hypothetical protein
MAFCCSLTADSWLENARRRTDLLEGAGNSAAYKGGLTGRFSRMDISAAKQISCVSEGSSW